VLATLAVGAVALAQTTTPAPGDHRLRPVAAAAVRIDDAFWGPKLETNRRVSIPHILKQNELTGRVANFVKAARRQGGFQGRRYNDTDVYKAVEAASLSLVSNPDPRLAAKLDELIALIAAAQEPDGYLYSARTADPRASVPGAGPERWSWLHTSHELYDAGHLYEAAVAHFQATGKRALLDVAIRNADLVCKTFGPEARRDVPGHQEIELALVKLYRVTGQRRYLDTARFFLEERGRAHASPPHRFPDDDPFHIYNDRGYRQDHQPLVEQARAVGHAVRATYMYAGATDMASLLGLETYGRAVRALFADVVSKRLYLTGGLGSRGVTEAFGDDYALPNADAYAETCAAIGGILWYQRLFLREGDAAPLDVLERTLYNGALSGVSLAGDAFFYQNPLASDGDVERSSYFDVACCPANLARLLAQLPGLIYAQTDEQLLVGLYIGSKADVTLGGTALRVIQETRYPWDGLVRLRLEPAQPKELTLALRIPGWARGEPVPSDLYRFAPSAVDEPASLSVNGQSVPIALDAGFVRVKRRWQSGDVVELKLPMPVRRVQAHQGVAEDRGRAALQRGPLVYCFEDADNGRLRDLVLPLDAPLAVESRPDLLGGVVVIQGQGRSGPRKTPQAALAVPYYAWANRVKGEMAVWLPFE